MKHWHGLSAAEVEQSRREHGNNTLTPPEKPSLWKQYIEKYEDPMIRILLAAAVVSLLLAFVKGEFLETIGIFIAIFIATTVGFYFEVDASRKFELLNAVSEEQPVKVYRDGKVTLVARKDVVAGDIVIVETGDEIPADGILLECKNMQVDESSLTGEPLTSKEVRNEATATEDLSDTAFPRDMVLRSSMVMAGRGVMRVSAVGDATEIGKVARTSSEATDVKTPLNIQLNRLGKMISWAGGGLSMLAFVAFMAHDLIAHTDFWTSGDYLAIASRVLGYFMMAVTLIVMAVPEGLPMAITLSLALNMRRMLKSNNLVRKLHASETMGAVNVICTDKTGTLTMNQMRITAAPFITTDNLALLHQAIASNTTAYLDGDRYIGNPTEGALLFWLRDQHCDYDQMRMQAEMVSQIPFSTETKTMTTTCMVDQKEYTFVKGAPEIVLARCQQTAEEQQLTQQHILSFQNRAMRTLALAVSLDGESYQLQAIFGISDPLRSEVPGAIAECNQAGISVIVVTGDSKATAMEIARQIALNPDDINETTAIGGSDFAALNDEEASAVASTLKVMFRARPTDKQRLVSLLQKEGNIVAVTGDGTNDAPALNHAHVGLSLGSGTSVAKQASDITIIDDSFTSIAKAVMWGRSLYRNIQRFLFFQLVVNVTALLLVLGGSAIGTEMPLTVTQILWVNLIMDTFAAMALSTLPPEEDVMKEGPRDQSQFIITPGMVRRILGWGLLFFAFSMCLLVYCERRGEGGVDTHELTIFFTIFVMLQFWNMFNAKSLMSGRHGFAEMGKNKGMLAVLASIFAGQWLIVTFGGKMFRTVPLSLTEWMAIIGITSLVAIVPAVVRKK